jgi:hypothetical protein
MEIKKFGLVFFLCLVLFATTIFASAPTYSMVDGNSATIWRTANFNIVFADVNSLAGGGIATAKYSLNGGAYTNFDSNTGGINDYNFIKSITIDGNYKINARFTAVDGNVLDVNNVFGLLDKTAPTIAVTSTSGFSAVGSNYYGTGTIVGGTAIDTNTGLQNGYSDLNTSSCEYTTDGTNWSAGTWSTDHCQATSVTINGGQSYLLGTRLKDNVGNLGTSAMTSVQGAMVVGDFGNVTIDFFASIVKGIVDTSGTLILIIMLAIVVMLVVDAFTGVIGIFDLIKKLK